MSREPLVIDLGCGNKKLPGAIGIDFSETSAADISLNLNQDRLPFDNDSVDFIYTSHTLEHLSAEGFMNVMQESYRVLKPDGQMLVIVPYFHTRANVANPFHNNMLCFNEHTFRFFSSEPTTPALQPDDYMTPSCPAWGLRYSANAEINIEFQTLSVAFQYMPPYRFLSPAEQRLARATVDGVVEQISFHLRPVKPCPQQPQSMPSFGDVDLHQEVVIRQHHYAQQLMFMRHHGILMDAESQSDPSPTTQCQTGDVAGAPIESPSPARDVERPEQHVKREIAKRLLAQPDQAFSAVGSVYSDPSGLFYGAAEVIGELDYRIQILREFIDEFLIAQEQREKAAAMDDSAKAAQQDQAPEDEEVQTPEAAQETQAREAAQPDQAPGQAEWPSRDPAEKEQAREAAHAERVQELTALSSGPQNYDSRMTLG